MKFQIKFVDRRGCGSFAYFEADETNMKIKACEKANEFLLKQRERDSIMSFSPFYSRYKPIKTVSVVEFHNGKTKRNGFKFKITLDFFEAKIDGVFYTDDWYIEK